MVLTAVAATVVFVLLVSIATLKVSVSTVRSARPIASARSVVGMAVAVAAGAVLKV